MKRILFFLFIMFFCHRLNAQANRFRPTYVCEGYIKLSEIKKLPIKLNYLVLLDSTIVGSYFYKSSFGTLTLTGKINKDGSFILYERDEKNDVTGCFIGKKLPDKRTINGIWTNNKNEKSYPFSLTILDDSKSYWSYIRKFRALPEYHNIQLAVKNPDKVVAFDIDDQAQTSLPKSFAKLKNVLSINIGGNQFKAFPVVISELQQLQELSMSSNGMEAVGPEIGNLKDLRILIINFNKLKELPIEIGSLKKLLYLELGNNQLKALPSTIVNLQQLQELHIERNKLSEKEKAKIKNLLPNCIIHFD
ncbi:leucine-rich repeat domain-containing protein [Pedobacter sp. B4-66]|uniref:leucine-rich repeat domain-containing protein n=1 Tax=Pedobacter sp. B4-66 TaxID=2817280 RepID=UPI001BDAF91E|nr:leucine-rich repeat domain-containing protein [Pedobacter sp. B4-66]